MPVRVADIMNSTPTQMSFGGCLGPFTFLIKSFIQGRVLNCELPENITEKALYYIAFLLDMSIWLSLLLIYSVGVSCILIKLIGG